MITGNQVLWTCTMTVLDVTDTAAIRKVVEQAFAELGRIDVVISNAGYGLVGAAEELKMPLDFRSPFARTIRRMRRNLGIWSKRTYGGVGCPALEAE
jgi:NAD(P)-dependent dehydrogenase (short-subunit alcohol dehydrogenase family)